MLVCGVHVLDGYETRHDVFEEDAHTEARDARCPHVSELKQPIFKSLPGRCAHQAGSKRPGSQTVTSFFSRENIDGLRRSRSFGISVSRRQEERRHQGVQNKKNHSIAVEQWARPPVQLPALWQASHTPFSSFTDTSSTFKSRTSTQHGQKKNQKSLLQQCYRLIDRGSDRGEATICSWICGTRTATIRCTRSTFNVQ